MTKDVLRGRREPRVLVVQDETGDRDPMTTKLTKAGYEVLRAEDGPEAIQLLRQGDNPFLVDTILCDVAGPRLGGEAAIRYIRTQYPTVPIIVLAGSGDLQVAVSFMKLGVADYLVRPISADAVVDVVTHTVRYRR